jgi:hypothetical protein
MLAFAVVLICLLSPAAAFATVKCQCNNGAISQAMGADYDDDDVDDACNDACSGMGGGRVWSVASDDEDGDDVTIRRGGRHHEEARPRS